MDGLALRLLDANANRAREGLRVVEDVGRFMLDDATLAAGLKRVRHALDIALRPLAGEALAWRDVGGDVGTTITTPTERQRASTADVARAAGKRVGEALRAIEEVLKIVDPNAAAGVERARYEFYRLEQRLLRQLDRSGRMGGVRVYVLITESICRENWQKVAAAALSGGADCLQLREPDLPADELLSRARWLVAACREAGAVSIVNDRPDIAVLSNADGVHVGQDDLPPAEVRKIVGPDRLVGVSTHGIEQAQAAVAAGADYLGVGPMFPSATKPRDILPGPAYAKQAAALQCPTVAIGGITLANVAEVVATGVTAVAVTACVCGSDDPAAAVRELRAAFG
jgi:thiamine-phosphate pyrophosphorylase